LDRGVDGFRLDAAKHVFGDTFDDLAEADILRNNDWWREFSDFVYGINSKAVLVGEVLGSRESLRRHAFGNDALVDEPFMESARSWIASPRAGFLKEWVQFVKSCRDVNADAHSKFPRQEPFQSFAYLASHDKDTRLASDLEERKKAGMQASVDEAYRLGLYVLMSAGKHPILYNGDELMQPGFKWNGNPSNHPTKPGDGSGIYDETLREPFPWRKAGAKAPQTGWFPPRFDKPNDGISVEEQGSKASMLSLVKALTNLRTKHPAFGNGEIGEILNDDADWLVFEKTEGTQRYLVMINSTGQGKDYSFHKDWFPQYTGAELLFWSDGQRKEWKNQSSRIDKSVFVPPFGFVLLRRPG
jgi:glycosidase